MSSSPANAVRIAPREDLRLRTALETKSLKFHISTAGQKWECTIVDRATHEKAKAAKESSSSSITDSEATTSSTSSSTSSH